MVARFTPTALETIDIFCHRWTASSWTRRWTWSGQWSMRRRTGASLLAYSRTCPTRPIASVNALAAPKLFVPNGHALLSHAASIRHLLARMRPVSELCHFDELVVSLSPLILHFDPSSGRCLNDYSDTILDAEEVDEVTHLLGSVCANLDAEKMRVTEERGGFFRRGILALTPQNQAITSV